ncbi:hypothetical protein BKA70DRAFT_1293821 [Coprinopsis sp. MPI-PUGE-AT-0042]|nr:hypothetical protein BKA70DRAFT_1293821 [Coprinopsis sp. MPI-PUGE-AT-0042]
MRGTAVHMIAAPLSLLPFPAACRTNDFLDLYPGKGSLRQWDFSQVPINPCPVTNPSARCPQMPTFLSTRAWPLTKYFC